MLKSSAPARLVGLFIIGWFLVNFPLVMLWDQAVTLLGLPLLPIALFVIWLGLIVVLAWVMEKQEH